MNKLSALFRDRHANMHQQSMTGSLKRISLRATLLGLLFLSAIPASYAQSQFEEEFDDLDKPWEEIAIQLPAAPQTANLLPFYVGPTTKQSFALDEKSLAIGKDGVIRYTLVAISPAGAKNISYEGIRCASFEKKIYAFGREDGTWSRSRRDQWELIVRGDVNRQHAALAMDYFCSNLTIVGNEKDMLRRIKFRQTLTDDLLRQ